MGLLGTGSGVDEPKRRGASASAPVATKVPAITRFLVALLALFVLGQSVAAAAHGHGDLEPAAFECALCHIAQDNHSPPPPAPAAATPEQATAPAVHTVVIARIVASATRAASARGPPPVI